MSNVVDVLAGERIGRFVQVQNAVEEQQDHFDQRRYEIVQARWSSLECVHRLPRLYITIFIINLVRDVPSSMNNNTVSTFFLHQFVLIEL